MSTSTSTRKRFWLGFRRLYNPPVNSCRDRFSAECYGELRRTVVKGLEQSASSVEIAIFYVGPLTIPLTYFLNSQSTVARQIVYPGKSTVCRLVRQQRI